jgi:hypothetical protein
MTLNKYQKYSKQILSVVLFVVGTSTALLANKAAGIVLTSLSQIGFLASAYRAIDLLGQMNGGSGMDKNKSNDLPDEAIRDWTMSVVTGLDQHEEHSVLGSHSHEGEQVLP